MRLLTQNMLTCRVRACEDTASRSGAGGPSAAFPLRVEVAGGGIVQKESEFSAERILHLLPKLDWPALKLTAAQMGIAALPDKVPDSPAADPAFLKSVHDLVMDIHVTEGRLVCPHCGRAYPIHKSIPNMLLNEDEV
jgi:multifunctional methyltransferase subunit TRM112